MSQRPKVVCGQCGCESSGLVCSACEGALIKICPNCNARNSFAKNFCDGCAADISLLKAAASNDIPQTATRKVGAPVVADQSGLNLPKAGRSQQSYSEPVEPAPQDVRARAAAEKAHVVPGSRPLMPSGFPYFLKSVAALLFLTALIGGVVIFLLYLRALRSPEKTVPLLAKRYLEALIVNDYASAYGMLSIPARVQCPLDEFRLLRDTTPWSWSNIVVSNVEPEAVVLRYDRAVQGRGAVKDSLIFIKEGDRWVYPNNKPLLKQAESAIARGDPDMAFIKIQEAVRVDPRDPLARAYLCEGVSSRKLSDQAESECRTALLLAGRYPSPLSEGERHRLHAALAAAYGGLRKFPEAIEEYSLMLSLPGLSAQDRCTALLARSQAQSASGRSAEAAQDLRSAQSQCSSAPR